ncbi:MAG: carboxypeptidase-like regulatory domain-containing protein [Pyrinomonadaceae bacterium]
MRKLFVVALIIAASFSAALAQGQTGSVQNTNEIPNMGHAPKQADGVGRLDLRVVDENGNPVQGVRADLDSHRAGGFLCQSWNWTDARGVSVLPPLHMGRLTLTLKAKGFETQKLDINPGNLDEPVRVTLTHKK